MKKKLIFVLGADFSGTTLLDLLLGSSNDTASLGEIASFYHPTASRHLNPQCSCQTDCGLWDRQANDIKDPYSRFYRFHNKFALVDSSKDPSWVLKQVHAAKLASIQVYIVLIWKQAHEYALSCANRGNASGWPGKWLRYHRAVMQLNMPLYTVELASLRNDKSRTLAELCQYTGIEYSEDMESFHSRAHHIAFGSSTARQSLHEPGSEGWHREASQSHRNDLRGAETPKPAEPNDNELAAIEHIQSLLKPDGKKPAQLLHGKRYLRSAVFRKKLERATYLLGLNPSVVRQPIRAIERYSRSLSQR